MALTAANREVYVVMVVALCRGPNSTAHRLRVMAPLGVPTHSASTSYLHATIDTYLDCDSSARGDLIVSLLFGRG